MSLKKEDVVKTIQWTGDWRVVFVKTKGDHMKVRNGTPTSQFWDLWRKSKDEIKKLGISVKKEEDEEKGTSAWVISYWMDANESEKEEAKEAWNARQQRDDGEE